VLCDWVRYTAQSLQITETGGVSATNPIALSPSGPTTTDTMQHVTVLENSQTDVTTKFVGSVAVEKTDDKVSTFDSPSFIKAMTTEFIMTLKKALCRPIQVASGSWATSDAVGTNLYSGSAPEALLAQSIVQKKVDGFQGIRGSITFRLQATSNPFQQGCLKLQHYPMQAVDASYTGRAASIFSWSFWPNVELNLGKETACEMRIPFTLPVAFCDLITTTAMLRPQMASVYVKVYNQLKCGPGTSSVGWNLYAHWNEDDLELFNPTTNAYQSGVSKKLTHATKLASEWEKKGDSISDSLAVGAKLADLATAVPVLADVAGPTAWALRIGARVASAFGFNRPPIDSKPIIQVPYEYPYQANVEGPDVALPLSLTIQPTLKFEPSLSSKKEDEMSIDYFVTKFGYISTLNLDTSAITGQNILNLALGPGILVGGGLTYPMPYQMLARLFEFWRGNMRIRFKFVKTKMHVARLMFCFFPGTLTAKTLTDTEYVHREVIDLATVEELVYELPFTSQFPYLATGTGTSSTNCYGSFQVLVVNPLQAPTSVVNNIDIIVEMAMGEGSEWFSPVQIPNILPTVPNATLEDTSFAPPKSPAPRSRAHSFGRNTPQAGASTGLVKVTTLSDAKITGQQTETSQLCVGEQILSLRQLIKYATSFTKCPITQVTADGFGTFSQPVYFNPFFMSAVRSDGTLYAPHFDMLSLLAPYFRFSRGCMRVRGDSIRNLDPEAASDQSPTLVFNCKSASDPGVIGMLTSTWYPPGGDNLPVGNKIWKYLVPAWQTVPMVPHHYTLSGSAVNSGLLYRQMSLTVGGYGFTPAANYQIRMARQPADDYELIGFLGPPQFTAYSL
jgi:hypothetical protein